MQQTSPCRCCLRVLFSSVNALLPYEPPKRVRAASQRAFLQHLQLMLLSYALDNHDHAICTNVSPSSIHV